MSTVSEDYMTDGPWEVVTSGASPAQPERFAQVDAYERWVSVSSEVLNDPHCDQMLTVIGAASAAMAELHSRISQLEREKADQGH